MSLKKNPHAVALGHIRQQLPRKGGNSFYRDTTVRQAHTLCGAAVTDRDVDYRYAGTKVFAQSAAFGDRACAACVALRTPNADEAR
jgi:hypothetical protein